MYLVAHPNGYVLFDCGLPVAHLVGQSEMTIGEDTYVIEADSSSSVDAFLTAFYLTAADILAVVVSHLHFDHAGGLSALAGVPTLIQEVELSAARERPDENPLWSRPGGDFSDLQIVPLTGDHDVFGDGSVVALATPGHTPGHQCLFVRLGSGEHFVLGGDLVYYPEEFRTRRVPAIAWSREQSLASIARVSQLLDSSGARLLLSHDPDYLSEVRLAPGDFYGTVDSKGSAASARRLQSAKPSYRQGGTNG
jgi:glyoxylase-like metal-dependent hydrolase (beta-lactamase superfamily II)